VALKAATIRVSPELWQMLEQEAALQEISVSQFVRDAALLRVGYLAGARGGVGGLETVGELALRTNEERRRFSPEERRRRLEDPARLAAIEKAGIAGLKEDRKHPQLRSNRAIDALDVTAYMARSTRSAVAHGCASTWSPSRSSRRCRSAARRCASSGSRSRT
jgi:hypothetical protein